MQGREPFHVAGLELPEIDFRSPVPMPIRTTEGPSVRVAPQCVAPGRCSGRTRGGSPLG
jgi:hypothetical protein